MPDGDGGPAKRVEWRRSDGSDQSYDGYYRGRRIAHLSRQGDGTRRDVWEVSLGTDEDLPDAGALPWAEAVAWVEARVAWLAAFPGA
jgi:hypothetical protein